MLCRRAFLYSSFALPAALTCSAASRERRVGRALPPAPAIAIADRHLEGSDAFVIRAQAGGWQPFVFAGDAAGLWMRELEPRLRAGSVAIAGYTSAATLFCLDVLACDFGARLVERRELGPAVAWRLSSSPLKRGALAPSNFPQRG